MNCLQDFQLIFTELKLIKNGLFKTLQRQSKA